MAESRLLSTGLSGGDGPQLSISSGSGAWFTLSDGRRVLDASNTAAPLGHSHPEIVEAVKRAAEAPVINEGLGWDERDQAAEDLVRVAFAGEEWVGSVRFFVSAGEANDVALALCQALTGRPGLATRERAYHGGTGLARELTVQPQWHGGLSLPGEPAQSAPRIAEVNLVAPPRGARVTGPPSVELAAEDWRNSADQLRQSAAVLLDYSQGGIYHSANYQDRMAALAQDSGTLWIADETVTGFGRVGGWFQFQKAESRPDIVTIGKPMTAGGAPGGALVFSRELSDRLRRGAWQTYSTFRAHPTTMAALRAHLAVSSSEGLFRRAETLDQVMLAELTRLADTHPSVARIDGRGLHWTIELHGPDWRDWTGNDMSPLASEVAKRALDADVLLATSGEQTSIFLAPPLVVSDEELKLMFDALDDALRLADERTSALAPA